MKRRKPQLPSPETKGVGVCVCPLRGGLLRGPLALVCVSSETQTRGSTMARLTSHPSSVTLAMLMLLVLGLSFCKFLRRKNQCSCACKQEFDRTGPDAQETAKETEWGQGTELQDGKLGKEDSQRGQRLTARLCGPSRTVAVLLLLPFRPFLGATLWVERGSFLPD